MTKLLAGRELDAAIAERLFGIPTVWDNGILYRKPDSPRLKPSTWIQHYSENMGDAWQVAEWLRAQTGDFMLLWDDCNADGREWECTIYVMVGDSYQAVSATADTPAEAICHAALELKERLEAKADA